MKLEKIYHVNIDLCHERYQFSTTTKALSGSIKDSINNVRIHEKNLFWINKRPFKFDKRMHEFKISRRGLKDLLE